MIKELDAVVLNTDLPEFGLEAGDVGTVVLVHAGESGYEVKFATLSGETLTVAASGVHLPQTRNPDGSPGRRCVPGRSAAPGTIKGSRLHPGRNEGSLVSAILRDLGDMTRNTSQPGGEVALFVAPDGQIRLDVRLERDTVWLTQAQMVELFGRDQSVISRHIGNVFKEGELSRESNMQKMHIANSDKPVEVYNLDVIISVGYRVKSQRGTPPLSE